MTSHAYHLTGRDWIELTVLPLAPALVFAVLMHAGARTGLLPKPRPATDVDRTILLHQADASRGPDQARWLLLGDSSCLMNVDAQLLSSRLAAPALNLGTSSYLNMEAYGNLAREFVRTHPGELPAVVLLMHPETLRLPDGQPYQARVLARYLEGKDTFESASPEERLKIWMGLRIFGDRILSRVLPQPLPGAFGRQYGFARDLEAYMSAHRGSLLEPATAEPSGNPVYLLHPNVKKYSAKLRSQLPEGIKLFIGISPLPESFVAPDYPATHRQLLDQWAQWIGATATLEGLPVSLPASFFATKTHLNQAGVLEYTQRLAAELARQRP